jgi:hypothetical protein
MRQPLSKAEVGTLSSVLAFVLLLSNLSSISGIVVVPGPTQPEFTINICQPIHALDRVSNSPIARPALNAPEFVLSFLRSHRTTTAPVVSERNVAPDTPPPKPLV